jgi:hypothetical protein
VSKRTVAPDNRKRASRVRAQFTSGNRHFRTRAALLAFASASLLSVSAADPAEITHDEARGLVLADLRANGYDVTSPKFELDDIEGTESFAGWYQFQALFDTPDRLAAIDVYAVERTTADMWALGLCKRPRSSEVRRIQRALRRKYKLRSPKERTPPGCDRRSVFDRSNRSGGDGRRADGRRPR